jgi:hypothetical protein
MVMLVITKSDRVGLAEQFSAAIIKDTITQLNAK